MEGNIIFMHLGWLNNDIVKKMSIVSLANIAALGIGFIISLILPKCLGAYNYGIYSLVTTILGFLSVVFEFGFIISVARLIVSSRDNKKNKALMAIGIKILIILGLFFAVTSYIVSYCYGKYFNETIGAYIAEIAPYSITLLFTFSLSSLFQALGEVYRLAAFNFFSKLVCGIVIVYGMFCNYKDISFYLNSSFIIPIFIFLTCCLKWLFKFPNNAQEFIKEIVKENIIFGFKNYVGRLIGTPVQYFTIILLGMYVGPTEVGIVNLCMAFATPIMTFSSSMVSVKFKDFAGFRIISKKFILSGLLVLVISTLAIGSIGSGLFYWYYNNGYTQYIPLLWLILFSFLLNSFGTPFNEWLSANGKGHEMLIISCFYGAIMLIVSLIFLKFWETYGIAIGMIAAKGYYFIHSYYYYRISLIKNKRGYYGF